MYKKTFHYFIWIGILSSLGFSCRPADSSSQEITADDFLKVNEAPNALILDVRTSQEYERGHLPDALLMDIYSPGMEKRLNELDPSKTYYVYCHSGARSRSIVYLMRKRGFSHVYNIRGGMLSLSRAGASFIK
jgi:rhodanese-related sulfurtransferase